MEASPSTPVSTYQVREPDAEEESSSGSPSPPEPVLVSAALPPNRIIRTRKVWSKLLHAAVLPLLVGIAIFWLKGEFSADLFRRAWPVMTFLAAAYVGAWVLSSKFERFPFINQFEGALVSVSVTLVPAGLVFAARPGSPINVLALIATVGSIGWYLADKFLHRYRTSRLLVLPGGASDRLLSVPGITREEPERLRWGGLDGVVADLHAALPDAQTVLADYSMRGLPTYHTGYIYELLTARVLLGATCEASVDLRTRRYYPYVKRAMDLLLIGVSLPITGPIMALTALAIRLESKGPVLFWQERVGRGGKTFQMAKFRSMRAGNEGEKGDVFASEEDDRVTVVGRFIRKARIDELPQFWNVLKGEMSLIGPRPEQVGLAEDFDDSLSLYHTRHLVRPGITGWAQVLHGYAADEDETRRKLEHDLNYLKHHADEPAHRQWSRALDYHRCSTTVGAVGTAHHLPEVQDDSDRLRRACWVGEKRAQKGPDKEMSELWPFICRSSTQWFVNSSRFDMDYRDVITVEPGKRGGKPCIRGMRITVYDVLGYFASGMTSQEILEDFPYLTEEDLQACLQYAAERERHVRVGHE